MNSCYMILVLNWLIPKGYRGMTLFPFIILKRKKSKEDVVLINHEKIHLRQQLELLVIPFYIWYLLEFLIRLLITRKWKMAYLAISFEQEAYKHQKDLHFLKSRPFWNFLKFY
ncbi:MAG: hypothetical protein ACWA5P_12900 [bacterium]